MIKVLVLLGMFIGVALGVTPQMPNEWRLAGLVVFLAAAVAVVIAAIRKRRGSDTTENAACLAIDQPGESSSDGSDP